VQKIPFRWLWAIPFIDCVGGAEKTALAQPACRKSHIIIVMMRTIRSTTTFGALAYAPAALSHAG